VVAGRKAPEADMTKISWEHELRAAGGRVTPQRRLIANILQEQDGHLSADEIYLLARQRHASISLATVYRTLGWLKESGLVSELRLTSDRCHYEIDKAHQHMVCLLCGKVIEFACSNYRDVLDDRAIQHGFRIARVSVKLLGYCADCQTRMHNEKQ
jgi:Fe2+ or Zn2+ uptake regulation protein